MLGLILGLAALALKLANYALLAYCIMSFVMPQSDLYYKLSRYVQPVLDPVRRKLWQWIPSLRTLPVDVSPLGLWLALDILMWIVNFLRSFR